MLPDPKKSNAGQTQYSLLADLVYDLITHIILASFKATLSYLKLLFVVW